MSSHVYAMQCGAFMKIGISCDLESRIYSLQYVNPYDISVLRSIEYGDTETFSKIPIRHAFLIEQEIQRVLINMKLHHRGEWFISIEAPLKVYDKTTTDWGPERIGNRCKEFMDVCILVSNVEKIDKPKLKIIKKDLGADGESILQRFRRAEPRGLAFLSGNNIERVRRIIGA